MLSIWLWIDYCYDAHWRSTPDSCSLSLLCLLFSFSFSFLVCAIHVFHLLFIDENLHSWNLTRHLFEFVTQLFISIHLLFIWISICKKNSNRMHVGGLSALVSITNRKGSFCDNYNEFDNIQYIDKMNQSQQEISSKFMSLISCNNWRWSSEGWQNCEMEFKGESIWPSHQPVRLMWMSSKNILATGIPLMIFSTFFSLSAIWY